VNLCLLNSVLLYVRFAVYISVLAVLIIGIWNSSIFYLYGSLVILSVCVFIISGVHYVVKNGTRRKAVLIFTKYNWKEDKFSCTVTHITTFCAKIHVKYIFALLYEVESYFIHMKERAWSCVYFLNDFALLHRRFYDMEQYSCNLHTKSWYVLWTSIIIHYNWRWFYIYYHCQWIDQIW
jgi:hypothetical protein